MRTLLAALATALAICPLAAIAQDAESKTIPGIGPTGEVKKVAGDFAFTEGPAADGQGNLYFSDIPNNRIHLRDASGELSVFIEPSGHANGLMVQGGRLLACQMDGRLASIDLKTKDVEVLADGYQGKRFNAPNDLVIDRSGGIYFTDPRFRAPEPWPQGKEAVYYRSADGEVTRLLGDLPAPNGVILSPDEKTLYVIPSLQKEMMAYPVEAPGKIGEGRVFCTLEQPEGRDNTGGDGLTIDTQGNLYITSALGVQVFNPEGKQLGIIRLPEQPSNATFGGNDRKTLFMTARTSLYSAPMEAEGHVFPGPQKR
ncbi:MAG: SMP-30/gluconolactonase/LRE family protein [Planctomycetes bacterium]|nr:SMP-30/gluconolactonase/LRE family protein [Planctomycetota bacterium]